jgi:hypothetical protein
MTTKKGPFEFTVEGTYPFPTDMLRYDQCWPKREAEDSVQLSEAMMLRRHTDPDRKRRVTLTTNKFTAPTTGRWESFGWKVVAHGQHN